MTGNSVSIILTAIAISDIITLVMGIVPDILKYTSAWEGSVFYWGGVNEFDIFTHKNEEKYIITMFTVTVRIPGVVMP